MKYHLLVLTISSLSIVSMLRAQEVIPITKSEVL